MTEQEKMTPPTIATKWYASSHYISRMGPYLSERAAWNALRRVESIPGDGPYVEGAHVWPDWEREE